MPNVGFDPLSGMAGCLLDGIVAAVPIGVKRSAAIEQLEDRGELLERARVIGSSTSWTWAIPSRAYARSASAIVSGPPARAGSFGSA